MLVGAVELHQECRYGLQWNFTSRISEPGYCRACRASEAPALNISSRQGHRRSAARLVHISRESSPSTATALSPRCEETPASLFISAGAHESKACGRPCTTRVWPDNVDLGEALLAQVRNPPCGSPSSWRATSVPN